MLTEVLFVPHTIQDVTAFALSTHSTGHYVQTSPEPGEGDLPFAILKTVRGLGFVTLKIQ